MTWETITRTDHDGNIVNLSLDRPKKHNAQSPQLIEELLEAARACQRDEDTRVLVIDGNGPSFSAGHDLGREGYSKEWTVEERLRFEREVYFEPMMTVRDLDVPTIAQVHGYCGAAGMMLMCVCDLAVATEDAQIANPVQRMAAAGLELLVEPWDIGFRQAKELLWTGESVSGTKAANMGLVNRAVPADDLKEETMTLARKVARMPPFALQLSKQSLNFAKDQMGQRDSFEYHLLAHQLSHASKEWAEWHKKGNEILKKEGLSSWIEYRDNPFEFD